MASALPGPLDRAPRATGKRGFANRALGFAKRAPGSPILWIATGAATGVMIVTGGFGTSAMPLGQRAAFWLLLMGWTAIKWQSWFLLTIRSHRDWLWATALGALLLSLPLPLEIALSVRAIGAGAAEVDPMGTWGRALAISAVLFVTTLLILRATGHLRFGTRPAVAPEQGLLARARADAETLASIQAEDHYCRVHRADGSDALIHYRFGDALAEVAEIDGEQVHRGAWVAATAVAGAIRDGRRWHLMVGDDRRIAVSATHMARVRARGWLRSRT